MFDKIIFYNALHFGDVFVSTGFVSWVINNVPAKQYEYRTKCNPKILSHIPVKPVLSENFWDDWFIKDNKLYINTWYGACNKKYMTGTNIQTLFDLFKFELQKLDITLPGTPDEYIPSVDFSYYNIKRINEKIKSISEPKVVICNGIPLSGQAPPVDLKTITQTLIDKFPGICFFFTNQTHCHGSNVISTRDFMETTGNDLYENAYLCSFADVIVGRGSSPYTYCFNRMILDNIKPKMISLSCMDSTTFGLHHYEKYNNKFTSIKCDNTENIINQLSCEIEQQCQ